MPNLNSMITNLEDTSGEQVPTEKQADEDHFRAFNSFDEADEKRTVSAELRLGHQTLTSTDTQGTLGSVFELDEAVRLASIMCRREYAPDVLRLYTSRALVPFFKGGKLVAQKRQQDKVVAQSKNASVSVMCSGNNAGGYQTVGSDVFEGSAVYRTVRSADERNRREMRRAVGTDNRWETRDSIMQLSKMSSRENKGCDQFLHSEHRGNLGNDMNPWFPGTRAKEPLTY